MQRWAARLLTPIARFLGYGSCAKCHIAWNFIELHDTDIDRYIGVFALCQHCWERLSPEERLPFYRQKYLQHWSGDNFTWEQLERIVLAGG